MRHESSNSALRSSELEQVAQEADYVRLLREEEVERIETALRRAVAVFLKADERYLEMLAAARLPEAPPGIVNILARRLNERARAVAAVERRRSRLDEVTRVPFSLQQP